MFKRLLKHEFKSTYKDFLILFLSVLVSSLLFGIGLKFNEVRIYISFSIVYFCSLIGLVCLSFYYIYLIIGKSLFSKQGYLTFSLPISANQLIMSKVIVVLTYLISISLCVSLSVGIILLLGLDISQVPFGELLKNANFTIFSISFIEQLVSNIMWIIFILFIFALSNSGLIKKKRKSNPIIFAIGIVMILNIAKSLIYYDNKDLYLCVNNNYSLSIVFAKKIDFVNVTYYYSISQFVVNIIIIVVLYFLSKKIIEKKLELQ